MISSTLVARVLLGETDALDEAETALPEQAAALKRTRERLSAVASPELVANIQAAANEQEVERLLRTALEEALRELGPGLN